MPSKSKRTANAGEDSFDISGHVNPETVMAAQDVLRGRIFQDKFPSIIRGLDNQKRQLQDLIRRCAEFGESNSVLLIGPRGSGKSLVLKSVLEDLKKSKRIHSNLLQVHLSGIVETDDRLALLEITRQLQLENTIGDKVFGSFAETLAFLLEALRSGDESVQSILFVLDEFDLFAHHKNQTLLYNLFDVSQAAQAPICIVGLTCRLDVVELLEKRVKSRFSHRQIYFFNAHTFDDYIEILRSILTLPSSFRDKRFATAWLHHIKFLKRIGLNTTTNCSQLATDLYKIHSVLELLENSTAKNILQSVYYVSKDIRSLHKLLFSPVCNLSVDHPFLQPSDLVESRERLNTDSKSVMLRGLSVLEMCLMIAMKQLVVTFVGEPFNFEMVYKEYKRFIQSRGHTTQLFDKSVVLKAFEHLIALEFVKPVDGSSSGTQKEFRLMALLVEPSQITEALQSYSDCPTEVKHWGINSAV